MRLDRRFLCSLGIFSHSLSMLSESGPLVNFILFNLAVYSYFVIL